MKALVVVGFVLAVLALVGLVRHNTPAKAPPADPSQNSFPISPTMPVDAAAPESSQPVLTARQPAATALLAATTDNVVTQSQLQAAIEQVSDALHQVIFTNSTSTNGVSNYVIRRSNNNIDQLNGVAISGGSISNASVTGLTGLTTSDISGLTFATTSELSASNNIAVWGDSLTGGSGQIPYSTYLTELYQANRYVYNFGIGGDTSAQIKQRMLDYSAGRNLITIIWAGRNDIGINANSTIKNNIADMVTSLGSNEKYLILSVLNSSSEPSGSANCIAITQLNADLAALYPGHYLDVRTFLVSHYDPNIAQDVIDNSNDVTPSSLRTDTLHLTSGGYQLVAQQVYNFLTSSLAVTTSTPSDDVLTRASLQSLFASPWSIGFTAPNAGSFTDLNAVNFKTWGSTVLYASSTNASTYVGIGAGTELQSTSTPKFNTAVGYQALGNTLQVGASNTAVGYQTLFMNGSGSQNTAIGNASLQQNTTGIQNAALGYFSLLNNTTGGQNTASGYQALFGNTTGIQNVGIGTIALRANSTGSNNVAIGYEPMLFNTGATSSVAIGTAAGEGSSNYHNQGSALLGFSAGKAFQTGSDFNTLIGYQSCMNVTTGANNVLIGAAINNGSLSQVTTGSQNISIGYNIAVASSTLSGQLDIANIIYGTGNTNIGAAVSTGKLAIGTTTPYSRLSVWGTDSASSTLSLNVVNSASTTVFAVFNGGNAQLSGTLTQSSDRRLKTNIDILDASSSLASINSLMPVAYDWLDPEKGGVRQYGFIAQDVQQVFPNLVATTSATALTPDGTLGLNYLGLIAPLVEAVQTLSKELASLEATVVGFADSFTSKKITASQELCVGTTCVTETQLQAMLAGTPSVQISAPTPLTISGTTTPPSITIQGSNPATINVGDTYTDLGAIVHDNQGHDLSYRTFINGVLSGNILIDTSQAATDTIDYVATDTWGNTATSTRTVIIESGQLFSDSIGAPDAGFEEYRYHPASADNERKAALKGRTYDCK